MKILSNMLWVPQGELSGIPALKEKLTVRSKYEEVQPIKTYKEEGDWFGIPRNYYNNVEYNDQRVSGKHIPIQFTGQLRQQQEHVINEWVKYYEQGINDTLISTGTGSGKTVLALKIASILKVPFLVIVPREGLMGQWASKIIEFTNIKNGNIGYVQQTKCEYENKSASIGLIHSVCKDHYPEEFKNYFGLIVFDEAHLVGAQTFSEVAKMFPAKHRLGLSATLDRSDQMENAYYFHLGQNIITSKKSYQPKPKVAIYKHEGWSNRVPHWCNTSIKVRAWLLSNLAANQKRNSLIAYFASQLVNKGLRTIIIGERIEQLERIEKEMQSLYNMSNIGIYISHTSQAKKEYLLENADCILATSKMLDVGIDNDRLRGLVFATPMSDVRQVVGRIRRINDQVPDPIVVDIIDIKYRPCKNWAQKRINWYNQEGFDIQEIGDG